MGPDDLGGGRSKDERRDRDRWIGVYIGALAVLLAIGATGGSNAAKEATLRNIEASNMWAFFQAKNIRRTSYQLAADELETMLLASATLDEDTRRTAGDRLAAYQDVIKTFTSEPSRREGLDELFERAKALEAERDVALRKDPYFDYGQALLQIAIVLASVAIISGGNTLLAASVLLGSAGAFLTFNGFTLMVDVPWIG